MTAIGAAGITLGGYDRCIVDWLADWEPATCAVTAGPLSRSGPRCPQSSARRRSTCTCTA